MAKTKSYALSKTKVREMITEKFGTEGEVSISAVLELFSAGSTGSNIGTTLVHNDSGEVIGKRCSYFGVFMPIEQFGKRGENYSYQSKLGESLVRKARNEALNAKKLADEELADDAITVDEWKEKLSDIAEMKDVRVSITDVADAPVYYETADELIAAV